MPFVCGGHPRPGELGPILAGLEAGGASIAEVGFPYSDPIADGPVIASAMQKALALGVTPDSIIDEVAEARAQLAIGLVAMASISLVVGMGGPGPFCERIADAGFDGLIVPDVPLEEAEDLRAAAAGTGLALSLLVAATTRPDRAARIARACRGFVYLMARVGVTGIRREAPEIARAVGPLREASDLPIACGFGISTAEHVAAVVRHADAAIVGSALVRRLDDATDPASEAEAFTRELGAGLVVGEEASAEEAAPAGPVEDGTN